MPTADEIRATQRETWGKFSAGWEKWDDVVLATTGQVGEEIIRSLDVTADQHHLDVAAGTGEPGLSIAALSPKGRVVLADLSPEMLAAAQRRAAPGASTTSRYRSAAPTTSRSPTAPSTASAADSASCSSQTSIRRPLSSYACSSQVDTCAWRCGPAPTPTPGRRSQAPPSRRRWTCRPPTRTPRACSAARPLGR